MAVARIINKYPNRRLYDTADSRYITLEDVRRLVLRNEPFEVIDKKTAEDITHSILLQVIADQEHRGPSVMTEKFLAQLVRAQSDHPPEAVRESLEQGITRFLEQRHELDRPITDPPHDPPPRRIALTERSL